MNALQTAVSVVVNLLAEGDFETIENSDPTVYSVTADLYTEEEGKSDLALELRLTDVYDGAYETEVMDLRVL